MQKAETQPSQAASSQGIHYELRSDVCTDLKDVGNLHQCFSTTVSGDIIDALVREQLQQAVRRSASC